MTPEAIATWALVALGVLSAVATGAAIVLNWRSKLRHFETRDLIREDIKSLIEPHGKALNEHHDRISSLERAVRPWDYDRTPTGGGKNG